MKSLHRRDRRNVLLLSALLLALYYPAIIAWARGGWPFGEDAPGLFWAWRTFAAGEIRAGRWPLWNPWVFGGLPLALNGQAAFGYAPNIVFWVLPFKSALLLDALAHSVLLGTGGYFLGRALGLSRTASWLLGLCLGASGSVSGHVYAGHVTWHAARAWLPWMLWALALGLRTRRLRYAYALALFFFAQFAAGYPPIALMSVALCAAGFFLCLALEVLAPNAGDAASTCSIAKRLRATAWAWRWAAVAGALGLGLVASLALPLREVSGLSVHGSGLAWEQASELSGSWKSFARWVAPGAFNMARPLQWSLRYGAQEEASSIAILPTLLAMGAPLWARQVAGRRRVLALWALWAAMLACSLLALGSNTPLYRFAFEHVGLFRVLRFPVRWLEPWMATACVASAVVFDAWYRAARGGDWGRHKYLQRRLAAASAAAVLVGAASLGAAAWLGTRSVSGFWKPLALAVDLWRVAPSPQRVALGLRLIAVSEWLWAAALCVAAALIVAGARRPARWEWLSWHKLALALVAIELGGLFVRSQKADLKPTNLSQPAIPAAIAALQKPGERWVTSVIWPSINSGMAARAEVLNGYDAMNTSAFWSLAQAIEGRPLWVDMYQPTRLDPALRIGGVTHVLSHAGYPLDATRGAALEASEREWRLWRIFPVRDVWPRFFLTRRAQSVPEPQVTRALAQMSRVPTPSPGKDWPLLLTQSAQSPREAAASTWGGAGEASGRVLGWRARPNVVECAVEARAACWLGVSTAWSPSWRAFVNGRRAALERANGPFCALRVPRGASKIQLVYEPATWRLGSFVGLCALAALGAGAAAFATKRRAPST